MGKIETLLHARQAFGLRDGLLRLQYELRRGSGELSQKMRSAQGWDAWQLSRIAPQAIASRIRFERSTGVSNFFFQDARTLKPALQRTLNAQDQASAISEADRILAGDSIFFGHLSLPCGFPPKWFSNPLTGQSVSPQQPWTTMRFASSLYGDLKFILEPSRFSFIYPLARAYALTSDEKYPEAFWLSIEDWAAQSPPMSGPLWICGQECSLRILVWTFALHAFIASPSTSDSRVALLCSMIAAHAWRVTQTLGYARSQRSNHLVTEAVALWTTGTLYPEFAQAKNWKHTGGLLLKEAVLDQISFQGAPQQHSFNYHRMNLHLLLWTIGLAQLNSAHLPDEITSRAQTALEFMRPWVDPQSGLVPNYGSDDGSLIFPLGSASYRDYRPLLRLGSAILGLPTLAAGPSDEIAIWFSLKPPPLRFATHSATDQSDSGYFHLGDENSWAMIRAAHHTRRPYQADQLHVDLWHEGRNIARDPGTYLYNGPAPWNNAFAETRFHNTITVNSRDQMHRASRFLWLDWSQAAGKISSRLQPGFSDHFEGSHNGYRKLGVTHRRTVQWIKNCGWIIIDDLDARTARKARMFNLRLHWLTVDVPLQTFKLPFRVNLDAGRFPLFWTIACSVAFDSQVIKSGEPLLPVTESGSGIQMDKRDVQMYGWEASTYGHLQPAISILCHAQSALPVRFVTAVLTTRRAAVKVENGDAVICWKDVSETAPLQEHHSECFRVSLTPGASPTNFSRCEPMPTL